VSRARQVVLLTAVNVSDRQVGMAALREALTGAGYGDVQTLLRSGNVVLTSDVSGAELEREVEAVLAVTFGFEIPVVVRSRDEIAAVLERNPLAAVADDPRRHQVVFLAAPLDESVARELPGLVEPPEALAIAGRELYTWHPGGIGRSPLSALLTRRRLGVVGTARNWNTVTKLLALANQKA
jgi:uncharacterized protein (DUF1697 family)